jgi:hypothetical protein
VGDVGNCVGTFVGKLLGILVGFLVGNLVGFLVVGNRVGSLVGRFVGYLVGVLVGKDVGTLVGFLVGKEVGSFVGNFVDTSWVSLSDRVWDLLLWAGPSVCGSAFQLEVRWASLSEMKSETGLVRIVIRAYTSLWRMLRPNQSSLQTRSQISE